MCYAVRKGHPLGVLLQLPGKGGGADDDYYYIRGYPCDINSCCCCLPSVEKQIQVGKDALFEGRLCPDISGATAKKTAGDPYTSILTSTLLKCKQFFPKDKTA
jgi:hypothetical protein